MADMAEPFVIAMIPTQNGQVLSDVNHPMFLIKPKDVAAFKVRWDHTTPGVVFIAVENVQDLRGPFPRALP